MLQSIRDHDVAAGVAINPDTPLSDIEDCLDLCDLVLVMSVAAGFGGQAFNPLALERLATLRERLGSEVLLEVDGGINPQTIHSAAEAGAELFVVGSAIFKTEDYRSAVTRLHNKKW